MKEKLRNKKVVYTIIGIVSVLLVALAVTYAYWLVTKTQTGENEISSACLDISISGEKNDIELTNQFPMSDEDGMKLVPYEFTVTNNCNTSVDYQVALEATGTESSAMVTSSLKVALNDSVSLLSSNAEIDTTIEEAYQSRRLGFSKLSPAGTEGSSETHQLRIWIDENAPISEMNKTFTSKISVTIGQGIESPYEEGTLAYSILANAGGTGATSEIDATKGEHINPNGSGVYILKTDNYYYGTNFEFDNTTGKYTLSGTLTQATTTECYNKTKICGQYTLLNTNETYSGVQLYIVTDFNPTSSNYGPIAREMKYYSPYSYPTKSGEYGLYKTQDDLGDSYYFRGDVTNNYVQFGEWKEEGNAQYFAVGPNEYFNSLEECENVWSIYAKCISIGHTKGDPMYWRIVRINGDGSIRLIYDGSNLVDNNTLHDYKIKNSQYNSNDSDFKYIGYTYDDGTGKQTDSTIKNTLDTWYVNNLKGDYEKYVADSIFCNDREIDEIIDTNLYYKAERRIGYSKNLKLTCTNKSDRYTVNDITNGNGLLTNPVGLITADEVLYAGEKESLSVQQNNSINYLGNQIPYWTMTPSYNLTLWHVTYELQYYTYSVTDAIGVRPVINLKTDVEFTGNGTIDSPYKIVTE